MSPGRRDRPVRRAGAPGVRRAGPPSGPRRSPGRAAPATGLGGEQVEGRRAVEELLAARGRGVRDVWVAQGSDPSPVLDRIVELAGARRIPVQWMARARLDAEARTEAHQGVIAHAEALHEYDLDDVLTGPPGRPAFLVMLEGVTDPHNLGAVLRSAECAGATGVVLPRHSSARVTPTVAKAAAGAIEYLRVATVPGIPGALATLAKAGVWSVGLDAAAPRAVWGLEVADRPVALVMGSEGKGLSRLARARCDLLVSIPQSGSVASLNVSAAAAVACFEVARARQGT